MFEVPDRDGLALAVGDHVVVAAVVAMGVVEHHGVEGLTDAQQVIESVGPFLVGYAVAAVLVGCYEARTTATTPDELRSPLAIAVELRSVLAAIVGAAGIGLVIRTSPGIEGGATWPFGLVIIGTLTVGLLAWRGVAIGVRRYRSGAPEAARRQPAGE
jgi:hypothetical protein